MSIPPGGPQEDARDLAAGPDGRVHVYNGTFDPYLSTLDTAGAWSHRTYAGWSTVNNTRYGGLALSGDYAFATDMWTGGTGDAPAGIVRFNLADGTATRFSTVDFIDLSVGQDNKLYALDYNATKLYVFDPQTLAQERVITLPSYVNGTYPWYTSVAVNAAGAATTEVVVLLTPEDIDEAAKLSVEYRPPGS